MADKDKNGPVSGGKDEADWDFDTFNEGFGFDDDADSTLEKPETKASRKDDSFADEGAGDADGFGDGFDSFGFDDEGDDKSFAAPAAAPDDEDDGFPVPGAPEADDPFAAAAEDDAFGLEVMPTPGAMAAKPASGDPDEEFGDLGGDAFAESDGFGDDGGLFDDAEDAVPADDPFGDGPADPFDDGKNEPAEQEEEDDPFTLKDEEGEDGTEHYEAPAAGKPSRGLGGLVMPLALAASVAFVGFVGYSVLLPMFTSPEPQPVQTAQPVPQEPSFPSALPGQPGGLPVQAEQPPTVPPLALPQVPDQTAMLPQPQEQPFEPSTPDPSLPGIPSEPLEPFLPGGVGPAPQPSLPGLPSQQQADQPSIDDIVGGEGRGGIIAMRDGDQHQGNAEASGLDGRVDVLETRLAAIERRVEDIVRAVESIGSHSQAAPVAQPGAPQAPVAAPARADLSAAVPPLKPAIVDSATLKGVSRGLAWVSTPSGVVEVREGDVIPGAGKVLSIREYEGKWFISTPAGLVVQ